MTPELEAELHALFRMNYDQLLRQGRREALDTGMLQSGDETPVGGQVAFTVHMEEYELFLSYTSEPDEDLELIGGRKT